MCPGRNRGLGSRGVPAVAELSRHSQRRLSLPSDVSKDSFMALLARYPNVRVLTFETTVRPSKLPVPEADDASVGSLGARRTTPVAVPGEGPGAGAAPGALLGG